LDTDESFAEFNWFAREYPRVYRHHFGHAKHRLNKIYDNYQSAHRYFASKISEADESCFGMAVGGIEALQVYWDFESFLNAVSSSLDVLARIVGTAYDEQTPISLNKLCKKIHLAGYVDILRKAQSKWIDRMKDYRDCFVHFTSVDTMLMFSCNLYSNGFEVRCRIPINPNVRDIIGFRFSRRSELLKYVIYVYRQLKLLDKRIARKLIADYRNGDFPKHKNGLFFRGIKNT